MSDRSTRFARTLLETGKETSIGYDSPIFPKADDFRTKFPTRYPPLSRVLAKLGFIASNIISGVLLRRQVSCFRDSQLTGSTIGKVTRVTARWIEYQQLAIRFLYERNTEKERSERKGRVTAGEGINRRYPSFDILPLAASRNVNPSY